jgi:uncharacterized Zn-binding protein involved in type VI secretion
MSTLGFFRVVGAAISNAADRAQLQLRGLGMDGDNAGSEPVDDAVHVQPLGLFARAVVAQSLRAIGWRDGDDVHVLALWNKQIAQSPAVDSGETRAYSVGAPKVCLRLGPVDVQIRVNVTGEVQLAPDAADYAGKSVARVGDAVACGRFVTLTTVVPLAQGRVNTPVLASIAPEPLTRLNVYGLVPAAATKVWFWFRFRVTAVGAIVGVVVAATEGVGEVRTFGSAGWLRWSEHAWSERPAAAMRQMEKTRIPVPSLPENPGPS